MDDFRRFFLRGLAALVPTLLTLAILAWAYSFVNDFVGAPITRGMLAICQLTSEAPASWVVDEARDPITYGTPIDKWNKFGEQLTQQYELIHNPSVRSSDPEVKKRARASRNRALWQVAGAKFKLHLIGFVIAIILVYFVGFFLASFIGRTSWRAVESVLTRIPVVGAIYPNVKQVTDFLLSDRKVEFSGVVAVEYPSKGIWSVALRTGAPLERVQRAADDDLVTVFVPSSPTPITGYVIQVPKSRVIELEMSIDEALRFTISAGVIKPGAVLPGPTESDSGA